MAEKVCECIDQYKARRKQRNGKKRHYTIADLNRISLYVNRDEKMQPLYIIAELAHFHGYGYLFCRAAKLIDKAQNALIIFKTIFTALATSKVIAMIIELLKLGSLTPLTWWLRFIMALFILVSVFANKALALIESILGDDTISKTQTDLKLACAYIRKKYGEDVDAIFDDTFDFDLAHELAELAKHETIDPSDPIFNGVGL
jgi:hypothetical protein